MAHLLEWISRMMLMVCWYMTYPFFMIIEWIEKIANIMFGSSPEEKQNLLYAAYQDDVANIGRALPSLLHGLPPHLQDFKSFFSSLKTSDDELKKLFLKEPDIVHGGLKVLGLLEYGLSPKLFYDVSVSVGSLLNRANSRGYGNNDGGWEIILDCGLFESRFRVKDEKIWLKVIDTIKSNCCDDNNLKASLLFDWCVTVAHKKPYFFPDFEIDFIGTGQECKTVLRPSKVRFKTVAERWSATYMTKVEKV